MFKQTFFVMGVIAAMALPVSANTGAASFSSYNFVPLGPSGTTGYKFNVLFPVTVIGLSTIDQGGNGLGAAHNVGLWDSSGNLLASATVLSGTSSPLDSTGLYRYASIAALTLPVGTGYSVGSFDTGSQDNVAYYGTPTMAAGLTFAGGLYTNNGSLGRPMSSVTFTAGSLVVPEPASLGLLTAGAAMLLRRRGK